MNKEKIITIVIGVSVGVVVTGGYFAIKNVIPKQPQVIIVQPTSKKTAPTVSGANDIQLTIDSPVDRSSTSSGIITVSGKTVPSATLVLFSNADEKIASADAKGNFTGNLKIDEGENEISIAAFLQKTNSTVVHRNVTLEISP